MPHPTILSPSSTINAESPKAVRLPPVPAQFVFVPDVKSRLDPKTAQAALRHANPAFTLGKYTQTDNEELLAAQNMMLNSIFSAENGVIQ